MENEDELERVSKTEIPHVKPCPECDSMEIEASDIKFTLPSSKKEKRGIALNFGMELIGIVCKSCGFARFFATNKNDNINITHES